MALEDLLALLPDNTEGAITAADMRTIVTALYEELAGFPVSAPTAGVLRVDDATSLEVARAAGATTLILRDSEGTRYDIGISLLGEVYAAPAS